jgi:hypothetical protein
MRTFVDLADHQRRALDELSNGMLLVTRNIKDFAANDPSVRMPYKL